MKPAVFLDRDGVIIENRENYIRGWGDVSIYPQALTALQILSKSELPLFIVTNQSAIGRGIISYEVAQAINLRLLELIKSARARIDDVFMCPHTPSELCSCRKPQPGLLLNAARKYQIDLHRSILIGDALTDIEAGQSAGVHQLCLVLTGRGKSQAALPQAKYLKPFYVFNDLLEAAHFFTSKKLITISDN